MAFFRKKYQEGPFGNRSLFAKTLKTILTPEQVAKYETVTRWKKTTPYEQWTYVMVAIEGARWA